MCVCVVYDYFFLVCRSDDQSVWSRKASNMIFCILYLVSIHHHHHCHRHCHLCILCILCYDSAFARMPTVINTHEGGRGDGKKGKREWLKEVTQWKKNLRPWPWSRSPASTSGVRSRMALFLLNGSRKSSCIINCAVKSAVRSQYVHQTSNLRTGWIARHITPSAPAWRNRNLVSHEALHRHDQVEAQPDHGPGSEIGTSWKIGVTWSRKRSFKMAAAEFGYLLTKSSFSPSLWHDISISWHGRKEL